MSTAAKYFGEFFAGFPRGINNFTATKGVMSCSLNPSKTAASAAFKRAGSRRQFSNAIVSQVAELCLADSIALPFPFQRMPG